MENVSEESITKHDVIKFIEAVIDEGYIPPYYTTMISTDGKAIPISEHITEEEYEKLVGK